MNYLKLFLLSIVIISATQAMDGRQNPSIHCYAALRMSGDGQELSKKRKRVDDCDNQAKRRKRSSEWDIIEQQRQEQEERERKEMIARAMHGREIFRKAKMLLWPNQKLPICFRGEEMYYYSKL